MIVVVIIRGGATVTVAVKASGSGTTAEVTMPPKVKVTVALCATMRLGISATAKRMAVEYENILAISWNGCGWTILHHLIVL